MNSRAALVAPFTEYRQLSTPHLQMRKHGKTVTVVWSDGNACYPDFKLTFNSDMMNVELKTIWLRYKPQCNRRATFERFGVYGCMTYVPIDAGNEAVAIIIKYFTKALQDISEHPRRWE